MRKKGRERKDQRRTARREKRTNAPDPHPFLNIRRSHPVSERYHELRNLLDVDDVLVLLVCVRLLSRSESGRGGVLVKADDLRATGNLERVLLRHALLVRCQIPEVWRRETGVELLDAWQEEKVRNGKQRGKKGETHPSSR